MPTPVYGLPLYGDDDTAELDALLNGQSTALETALASQFVDHAGMSVATTSDLPASGNWNGRLISVVADQSLWIWLSGWKRIVSAAGSPRINRYARTVSSDSTVSSGTYVGLVTGTIVNAPSGTYLLSSRASIYGVGGPVVGRVYAEWKSGSAGAQREEARWDIATPGPYPTSATVQTSIVHPGGDLVLTVGYRRDSGTFAVTAQGSGETVIAATYVGP